MCLLRCAREDYDRVFPNQPLPRQTSNKSRTPVSIDPNFRTQERLTGLCMSPIFVPMVDRELPVNNDEHNNDGDESASDDGRDLEVGDTYLPFQEGVDENSPDVAYDPEYMKMYGQYNVGNLTNTTILFVVEAVTPPILLNMGLNNHVVRWNQKE